MHEPVIRVQSLGALPTAHPAAEQLDTFEPGRRCVEPDCITVLNHFNPGPWCLIHAERHQAELLVEDVA